MPSASQSRPGPEQSKPLVRQCRAAGAWRQARRSARSPGSARRWRSLSARRRNSGTSGCRRSDRRRHSRAGRTSRHCAGWGRGSCARPDRYGDRPRPRRCRPPTPPNSRVAPIRSGATSCTLRAKSARLRRLRHAPHRRSVRPILVNRAVNRNASRCAQKSVAPRQQRGNISTLSHCSHRQTPLFSHRIFRNDWPRDAGASKRHGERSDPSGAVSVALDRTSRGEGA